MRRCVVNVESGDEDTGMVSMMLGLVDGMLEAEVSEREGT